MPRLANSVPKYRRHRRRNRTDLAVVTLSGRDIYLGAYGSKASRVEYDRLIGEWVQNGRQLPSADGDLAVTELISGYWRFARQYYVKNGRRTDELASIKVALRYLKESYGGTLAAQFGPLALKVIRQRMIDAGGSRRYVNGLVGRIRRAFKWGVENELVPVSVHQALATVAGITKGKTDARETDPVLPVDDETVNATLPHLPKTVADMVRIQRRTGMRPEEICRVRPGDIERSEDVWRFVPESHKMEHKDRQRTVFLGPHAQSVLTHYLLRAEDQVCFVPQRRGIKAYSTRSYRDAIHRACARAFPVPEGMSVEEARKWQKRHRWNPNQLRHSAATEIRRQFGIEAVQCVLGHAEVGTAQIYAERDMAKAAEVMRQVG